MDLLQLALASSAPGAVAVPGKDQAPFGADAPAGFAELVDSAATPTAATERRIAGAEVRLSVPAAAASLGNGISGVAHGHARRWAGGERLPIPVDGRNPRASVALGVALETVAAEASARQDALALEPDAPHASHDGDAPCPVEHFDFAGDATPGEPAMGLPVLTAPAVETVAPAVRQPESAGYPVRATDTTTGGADQTDVTRARIAAVLGEHRAGGLPGEVETGRLDSADATAARREPEAAREVDHREAGRLMEPKAGTARLVAESAFRFTPAQPDRMGEPDSVQPRGLEGYPGAKIGAMTSAAPQAPEPAPPAAAAAAGTADGTAAAAAAAAVAVAPAGHPVQPTDAVSAKAPAEQSIASAADAAPPEPEVSVAEDAAKPVSPVPAGPARVVDAIGLTRIGIDPFQRRSAAAEGDAGVARAPATAAEPARGRVPPGLEAVPVARPAVATDVAGSALDEEDVGEPELEADAAEGALSTSGPGPQAGARARPDGTPPLLAAHVARQIQPAFESAVLSDRGIEIRLDPEELGTVRLQIESSDNVLNIVILADRQDTTDLLRRHVEVLRQEAEEAGFGQLTFSFGDAPGEGRQPQNDAPQARTEGRSGAPVPHHAPQLPRPGRAVSDRILDVRV